MFGKKISFWVMDQKPLDQSDCWIPWTAVYDKQVEVWSLIFICYKICIEAIKLLNDFKWCDHALLFIEVANSWNHFLWVWPGMSRHVQSYSKLWVSYISITSWCMKLIFCIWLDIYKYICLIQSIHRIWPGTSRHVRSNSQYWISNMSD